MRPGRQALHPGRASFCRKVMAASAGLALGSLVGSPARAWEQERSDVGAPHHWERRELTWRVAVPIPGLPGGGTREVATALRTWTQPACTTLQVRASAAAQADIELVAVTTAWQHESGDGAFTVVDVDRWSGAVEGARIEVNVAALAGIDLESLLLHEVGHALGLGHVRSRDAVMFLGVAPATQRRTLTPDDLAGVCALYPRPVGAAASLRALPGTQVEAPAGPAWWVPLAGIVAAAAWAAWVWWRRRK